MVADYIPLPDEIRRTYVYSVNDNTENSIVIERPIAMKPRENGGHIVVAVTPDGTHNLHKLKAGWIDLIIETEENPTLDKVSVEMDEEDLQEFVEEQMIPSDKPSARDVMDGSCERYRMTGVCSMYPGCGCGTPHDEYYPEGDGGSGRPPRMGA